jgi:pimeloyl-ACP methyl ester carboxylesterase
MTTTISRHVGALALLLAALLMATLARAERVTLNFNPSLAGYADYRPGDPAKPAILLLHGFLQTYEFPTIHRLAEGLSHAGYTVLAPNLTLGVTHRRQSLPCEAIHTHSLGDGMREVDTWVKWLKERHAGNVIVVGHSLGSLTLLAYLNKGSDPAVSRFIGVSIMEGRVHADPKEHERAVTDLKRLIREGARAPITQPYSFCKSLNIAPRALLSYIEWTPDRVMRVSREQARKTVYIMGSRDDRLGPGWIERLARTGVRVRIIDGANHFMDGSHEFDLLDQVIDEIKATPQ